MKNFKLKTVILFFIISLVSEVSFSQSIIDIASLENGNFPNNFLSSGQYYLKDVSNKLDNFLGTWEYINGNQKFRITLTKTTMFHVNHPEAQMNFYQDGIDIQYKIYTNNQLTYTSPINAQGLFRSTDGVILEGGLYDYGRLTKSVLAPVTGEEIVAANKPIFLYCTITKIMVDLSNNEPEKINFKISSFNSNGYNSELYQGQPFYSIPENITMVKVN